MGVRLLPVCLCCRVVALASHVGAQNSFALRSNAREECLNPGLSAHGRMLDAARQKGCGSALGGHLRCLLSDNGDPRASVPLALLVSHVHECAHVRDVRKCVSAGNTRARWVLLAACERGEA